MMLGILIHTNFKKPDDETLFGFFIDEPSNLIQTNKKCTHPPFVNYTKWLEQELSGRDSSFPENFFTKYENYLCKERSAFTASW